MPQENEKTVPEIAKMLAARGLDGDSGGWKQRLEAVGSGEVERALATPAGSYSLEKLAALISPAGGQYLEEMAQAARELTIQRFGRTIRLYAPLYVSNRCVNSCLYCGFSRESTFERTCLSVEQALADAEVIAGEGFRDLLLVSGEDPKSITIDYLAELASKLRPRFSSISIEIYPLSVGDYAKLFKAGIEGVTLYQETYDRQMYAKCHGKGPKSDYNWRIATADRMAAGSMREVGLGVLLGLSDWRIETLALAEHAHYLMKRYWQSHVSFSFPRLRPANDVNRSLFEHHISDRELVQMMTALRLCFADAGLVLSTRESARLRDNLVELGITRLSAGSKTSPGGYSSSETATEQFEVHDCRSAGEIAAMLRNHGLEPVWKDWDPAFTDA